MSCLEDFENLPGVGFDVLRYFGARARAGVFKSETRVESKNCDSAHRGWLLLYA